MTLKDSLNKIIQSTIWISRIDDRVREKVEPDWFMANGSTFTFGVDYEAIKQAFMNEGWIPKTDVEKYKKTISAQSDMIAAMRVMPYKVYVQLDKRDKLMRNLMTFDEWSKEAEQYGWTKPAYINPDTILPNYGKLTELTKEQLAELLKTEGNDWNVIALRKELGGKND